MDDYEEGRRNVEREITRLVSLGPSPTRVLDYHKVIESHYTPESWAEVREKTPRSITKNIENAKVDLDSDDFEQPNDDGDDGSEHGDKCPRPG